MTTLTSQDYGSLLDKSLQFDNLKSGSLIKATIEKVGPEYVLVNTTLKSESIIPLKEFLNDKDEFSYNIGDQVTVMIETIDNGLGETCLSREKAIRIEQWSSLERAKNDATPVMGTITERVKGGFTVDLEGMRAFLPGSQVDMKPVKDMNQLEQQTMEFKIVKMDKKRNNVVVSRRALIEESNKEGRAEVLQAIEEGAELRGIVKNLTDYGAFIDLGGLDGLLHITDMSWKRVKHPSDMIQVGEEITVKVLSFDKEKQRVSLGLKQLSGDPWSDMVKRFPVGTRLIGKVNNTTEYGCFVEIDDGIEGLVHMSELDWTNKNIHPSKVVQIDQEVEVMVLDIEETRRRISLGIKQCKPNPWKEFENNHSMDEVIAAKVKSITDFGIFLGLEGEIDGLVHINDIAWNQAGEVAIRTFKKGQEVKAVILSIDSERERISLGMKQIEADPFEEFFIDHPINTVVNGTINAVDSKRVVLDLPHGLQGSIKRDEFSEAELEVGSKIQSTVANTEPKNFMIQLTTKQIKATKGKKAHQSSSQPIASATFGDLMKDKLSNQEEEQKH
ncbi:MAG TPA: 30S ribosomal protein S1 [Gammaproteobacteria bacterium]|nr:30S ribosomal protein S1 [Gammaproteobacteria bacterium]